MKFKFLILIIIALASFFIWQSYANSDSVVDASQNPPEPAGPVDRIMKLEIIEDSTYGILMDQASITPAISLAIFNAAKDQEVYDLSNLRLGRFLNLVFDQDSDDCKQLIYQIDSEEKLYVTKQSTTTGTTTQEIWQAERVEIPYDIKIKTAEGTIESSMWETALDKGIDERAIIGFADAFQWSVDFAWEVRKDDSFKFVYEERYLDGEYIMPGAMLAGKFVNSGKELYAFYFEEDDESFGYFDQDGNSVQKIFLKAPVAFKYISSGFTTGRRYIQAFNISTGHRAIDYAASYGTPIRSVGDGTVVLAGWSGSYGNKVSVRHNSTYTTNYAHMSKIAVRYGQKVIQGQTIGYVGSTGLSTGPHLHYEMVKYGTKINPFYEDLPAGESIKEENKQRYFESIKQYQEQLK